MFMCFLLNTLFIHCECLNRLYDVNSGSIIIGGEDIKNLDQTWLRKQVIGLINQEPILFAVSILENIRYGKPEATDAEVNVDYNRYRVFNVSMILCYSVILKL